MARVHSPGYPNMALPKAVMAVRKIFEADRRNPIDRGVAAKHIGYSGPSGAADKALASLAHYGLVEKAGKGELRVTQLAMDILHPDKPEGRKAALLQAGLSPAIFAELRERFGSHFSEGALESYLLRANFQNAAIRPVIRSFMDTCSYLEQEKAFESGGAGDDTGGESDPLDDEAGNQMEDTMVQDRRPAAPPPAPTLDVQPEAGETEWMRNLVSRDTKVRLLVTGEMGPKEIGRLIKLLEAQKAVLDDDDDDFEALIG